MVRDMGPILKSKALVPEFQKKRVVVSSSGLATTIVLDNIIGSYMSLFIHFFLKVASSSFTHYTQASSFIRGNPRQWVDYLEEEMPASARNGFGVNQFALGMLFSMAIGT